MCNIKQNKSKTQKQAVCPISEIVLVLTLIRLSMIKGLGIWLTNSTRAKFVLRTAKEYLHCSLLNHFPLASFISKLALHRQNR